MDNDPVPYLDCPECGEPLFPATARGFTDDYGEYIDHPSECRCGLCDWGWCETFELTTCACGARCTVDVDEDRAYAHLVDVQREVTRQELPAMMMHPVGPRCFYCGVCGVVPDNSGGNVPCPHCERGQAEVTT